MPPANESPRPLRWRGAAAHHPYAFKLLFMSLAVPLLAAAVPARAFYRNHTPPRSGHGAYAESPEHAPPPDMATGLGRLGEPSDGGPTHDTHAAYAPVSNTPREGQTSSGVSRVDGPPTVTLTAEPSSVTLCPNDGKVVSLNAHVTAPKPYLIRDMHWDASGGTFFLA